MSLAALIDQSKLIKVYVHRSFGDTIKTASRTNSKGITIPDLDLDASPESKEKNILILKGRVFPCKLRVGIVKQARHTIELGNVRIAVFDTFTADGLEIARALTEQANYYEASSVLEILEDHEQNLDLSTKLVMGECYMSLGREAKAMRCINGVQKFLLKSPAPSPNEAFEMVDSMVDAGAYLRALILLPVPASLYEHCTFGDDAVEGMFRCMKKANDCARAMIKEQGRSKVLAVDFGLEFIEDCLERMLNLQNVDTKKLAYKHCHVSSWIAYIYWSLNDNIKGLKVRQKAVDHMDRAFGTVANQRRIYCNSYYNMGVGYAILNKHEKAKVAYQKAIDAIEHATEFDTEAERQKELQMYRQKLREVQ